MSTAFVRQLGAESGVQLNPLQDNSEIPVTDNADQVFAIALRATRGRIDKAFKVDRGNVFRKLGKGEPIRISALNEAWVHVVEALNNGAYEAVVQRLHTPAAIIKWAILTKDDSLANFTVSDSEPLDDFIIAIKHLECHNDGIQIEYHADEIQMGGVAIPNDKITLRLRDRDGLILYEFLGSLNPEAKDDYGNSAYLPDVVQNQTDALVVMLGSVEAIDPDTMAYGYANGREKWVSSGVLQCFEEGGTSYSTADYMQARERLQYTTHNYAYIASGGTRSPALLGQLAQLAFDTNRQLRFDVPGDLKPEAAIAFVEQLNMGASETAHLLQAFWMPIKSDDPTGVNPKGFLGGATLNIAYACGRNAQTNAVGFAPKNFVIAGRNWPIRRTRMTQMITPRDQELNALAKAKINPVLYEVYTGGGRYVFRDSLTCALVESSQKKLIAVADMSTSIDEAVTRAAKDMLQLPMEIAIKRMRDFLKALFENAEASGWLVPSNAPEMGGAAWKFDLRPNAVRPYDRMDCAYWLRYDGTTRQIFVTQTLTR